MTQSQTRPRLIANFETDAAGAPIFKESGGRRHYGITLEVQNPPDDAYAATFELDPSYYDPRRTLTADADGKFRLKTTSYGDYDVVVRLRTKRGEVPVASTLARALKDTISANDQPAVAAAIDYLAAH